MPLTYVVEHLNRQLVELHPQSELAGMAHYIYENGKLSACVGPAILYSDISDAGLAEGPFHRIHVSQLRVHFNGRVVSPDFVYQMAWSTRDVIFVDRFVRTLHALNHINEQPERGRGDALVVDVHWRHLCAVPDAHGEVFEQLLATLGLHPGNIVLRIEGNALVSIEKVRRAVANFIQRGYGICALTRTVTEAELVVMAGLGVGWLSGLDDQDQPQLIAIDAQLKQSGAGKSVA